MTYSTGNLIVATDYNGFVATTSGANINATWNTTYGQTALAQVAAGGTVTATQWSSLVTTLASMGAHSNTTITSRTAPVAGNIISILANVNTDITNCYNNRANAATVGTQYTAWTGNASQTTTTGTGSAAWQLTFTDTMTFANASAASNFFGAGGLVKVQFSKTSTGTAADTQWNPFIGNVVANSGVYLSGANSANIAGTTYTGTTKFGGSGTPITLATTTNFTNLTTTPVTIYKQFDTGTAYSTNYVEIAANVNANSNATVLTLVTTWVDAGDPDPGSNTVITGGTATTGITFGTAPATVVTYFPPETTNLTNTWGTPTVVSAVANSTPGYTGTYLIAAGGGGGGVTGGGGAGGLLTGTISFIPGVTYSGTVGTNGTGSAVANGTSGTNSTFSELSVIGGGFGGGAGGLTGGTGGSGGGSASGTTTGGTGTPGQGFGGGGGTGGGATAGGGGGGAGGTGGNGSAGVAGAAGNGVSSSITGSAVTYASGGAGGTGGVGTAGAANTGRGGGARANGGTGVVILSVPTSSYPGNANVSGTYAYSTSGSNTIIQWTTGSFTYIA